jgi:hypothetical protein
MAAIAERATAVIRKIDKGEIVASERVRRLIRMVAAVARHDEATERVAVALVLDRHDLLAKDATPYCKQSGVLIGHGSTRRKRLSKWYAGSPNKEGRTTVLRFMKMTRAPRRSAAPIPTAISRRKFASRGGAVQVHELALRVDRRLPSGQDGGSTLFDPNYNMAEFVNLSKLNVDGALA